MNTSTDSSPSAIGQPLRLDEMPDFMTLQQLADLLQISANTARAIIQAGELPATKIGRVWRISKSQLVTHFSDVSQVRDFEETD